MMLILYKLPFLEYPRKTELILNGLWDKHINIFLLELIYEVSPEKEQFINNKTPHLHAMVPYHFLKVLP